MSPVNRETLMAYADGQLDAAGRAAVEAHIQANPEAAAELTLLQRQSDAIRTLFEPMGAEPVPARLRPARIDAALAQRRRTATGWAVAAMLLLGFGLGLGWLSRGLFDRTLPGDRLIADALRAHEVYVAENRHAVEVAGSDSEHLSSWLSNRLSTPLGMPDLAAEGFVLVGGRLLPGEEDAGGRAAQLMYENADKQRLTIYVTAALPGGDPAYRFASYEGAEAFYWANGRITCTVVGELPSAQMEVLAKAVYRQMTSGSDGSEPRYRDL